MKIISSQKITLFSPRIPSQSRITANKIFEKCFSFLNWKKYFDKNAKNQKFFCDVVVSRGFKQYLIFGSVQETTLTFKYLENIFFLIISLSLTSSSSSKIKISSFFANWIFFHLKFVIEQIAQKSYYFMNRGHDKNSERLKNKV